MKLPSWHKVPGVRTGSDLSLGERAADRMKAMLATWTALACVLVAVGGWVLGSPFGDKWPYILLNLCLSAFAAIQCFVLLIAAKRADRISYEVAQATLAEVRALSGRFSSCMCSLPKAEGHAQRP